MWNNVDLAAEVQGAGGPSAFLLRSVSLRDAPALASAVEAQRAALRAEAAALSRDAASVCTAARGQLRDAQARLRDAADRAARAVSEHEERRSRLCALADVFREQREAQVAESAVGKCRVIADAYVNALHTLSEHHRLHADGTKAGGSIFGVEGMSDMDTVAKNIEVLIREVDIVRRAGARSLFGESLAVNKRILMSVENRCVDVVIKARAAFVNVMDNEFRAFGWPMKVPQVGENADMISVVNYFVSQLNKLQHVAERSNFVMQRTRWHRALSDSWAMAAILRAPLARFKYHFLENYRATDLTGSRVADSDNASTTSSVVQEAEQAARAADSQARASTARFDRPEWAAEFALARISEATPFLREIVLDDTCTADLKFAEGFCKVFANKIAYDTDLVVRGAESEHDSDGLVSHAADTTAQFDAKIRSGILSNNPIFDINDKLPSSLDFLSRNDSFFAQWALAEQRLALSEVLPSLEKLLDDRIQSNAGVHTPEASIVPGLDSPGHLDLEFECSEIVDRIGQASRGCRGLDARERMLTFVKWTELHLLEAIRSRLTEELTKCNWGPRSREEVYRSGRAAWVAHALANVLENKACERFYVALEDSKQLSGAVPFSTRVNGVGVASDAQVRLEEQSGKRTENGTSSWNASSQGNSCANGDAGEKRRNGSANGTSGHDLLAASSSSVYDVEIERLRVLSSKACVAIADTISDQFIMSASEEYQTQVRFGELPASNAAVVLALDLSVGLCDGMSSLEGSLSALSSAIANRKVSSLVWRPTAERLDRFFFEDVILQSFTGGQRNAVSASSAANEYMRPVAAGKMARQIAHDAQMVVQVFGAVTGVPERFLPKCADAATLLKVAAGRVLRPRAPVRQKDEELLTAVLLGGDDGTCEGEEEVDAKQEVAATERRRQVGIEFLDGREARECLVIAGMYDAIPMS